MKKKFLLILVCVIYLSTFVLSAGAYALADNEGEVLSAYHMNNSVHAFLSIEADDIDRVSFSKAEFGMADIKPSSFSLSNSAKRYVVLLDNTDSMNKYSDEVRSFVVSLLENGSPKASVLVIPFQETLQKDALVDSDAFLESESPVEDFENALKEIENEDANNYSFPCIIEALDYIDANFPAKGTDVVNLILVTDGIDKNSGNTDRKNDAKARVSESPEVILSTVLVDSGYSVLDDIGGKGIETRINRQSTGEDAAKEIGSFINGLYHICFQDESAPDQARFDFEFFMKSKDSKGNLNSHKLLAGNVPVCELDEASGTYHVKGVESEPLQEPAEQPAGAGQGDAANNTDEAPDDSEGNSEPEAEEPADGEDPEETGESGSAEDAPPMDDEQETGIKIKDSWIYIAIGVLAAIVLTAILCKKSSRRKAAASSEESVYMKLVVANGKCKTKNTEIVLKNQLIIGRSRKCDIVFNNPEVSAVNTRVYTYNGMVYIEDMNSQNGTAIEGMKIYSPNRLRSGDEISIGTVRFSLKF